MLEFLPPQTENNSYFFKNLSSAFFLDVLIRQKKDLVKKDLLGGGDPLTT